MFLGCLLGFLKCCKGVPGSVHTTSASIKAPQRVGVRLQGALGDGQVIGISQEGRSPASWP